jgi:hypothetical protein
MVNNIFDSNSLSWDLVESICTVAALVILGKIQVHSFHQKHESKCDLWSLHSLPTCTGIEDSSFLIARRVGCCHPGCQPDLSNGIESLYVVIVVQRR